VRQDRWHSLTAEQREGFLPLCPDFVIKLHSKTDSLKQLHLKMEEYLGNGARLGWLIDPQDRHGEIDRPGQAVEILDRPSTVSGETDVPGFTR
jgi:Uma2 family endonuclease